MSMHQAPFASVQSDQMPMADKLMTYLMRPAEDNSVPEALYHHQAVLASMAGAIGRLEARISELEQKLPSD